MSTDAVPYTMEKYTWKEVHPRRKIIKETRLELGSWGGGIAQLAVIAS